MPSCSARLRGRPATNVVRRGNCWRCWRKLTRGGSISAKDVHRCCVLHPGAPLVGACSLSPHRSGAGGTPVSSHSRARVGSAGGSARKDQDCQDVQTSQDLDDVCEILSRISPHSCSGEARGLGPRRGSMRIRRTARSVHGNRVPRIPPRHPVCAGRIDGRDEHRRSLPRAQQL